MRVAVRSPTLRARALIILDGRLVVSSERRQGRMHLSVPGGRVKFGEPMAEALVREVAEETGLEVEVGSLVYVAEVVRPHRRHDLNLIFAAVVGGGTLDLGKLDLLEIDRADHDAALLPPILGELRDDLGGGWPPSMPRWLGNVYRPESDS
jgi:ADP-ribose pyrophosphatase YjhB (NUDIX family)